MLRGLLFLLPPALGERRSLLLRLLARARLGERLGLGALALDHEARRLRFGLGARMGDAAQLDLRGLALAREVEGRGVSSPARACTRLPRRCARPGVRDAHLGDLRRRLRAWRSRSRAAFSLSRQLAHAAVSPRLAPSRRLAGRAKSRG